MTHPTPDRLAVLAQEEGADAEVLGHVGRCPACRTEVDVLQQVVQIARSPGSTARLAAPHPRVWQRVARNVHDGLVLPLSAHPVADVPLEPPGDAGPSHSSPPVPRGRAL